MFHEIFENYFKSFLNFSALSILQSQKLKNATFSNLKILLVETRCYKSY